jgi:hypothetical protein
MVMELAVSDRLFDLQLELGKVNGLVATMRAIGSSEGDGPSSEDVMNMIRVLEDIVSPAYEELTAIVEEVEEECETPCPPQGEMAA